METTVVNIKKESYDFIIARPSVFGNPFKIGIDGNRDEVIKKFEEYFHNRLANNGTFKKMILALKGKRLG